MLLFTTYHGNSIFKVLWALEGGLQNVFIIGLWKVYVLAHLFFIKSTPVTGLLLALFGAKDLLIKQKKVIMLELDFSKNIYFIPLHRFRWLPTFWILSHIFRTKIKEVLPPSRRKRSECRSFYHDPISRFVPKTLYKCIWSISYHRNKKKYPLRASMFCKMKMFSKSATFLLFERSD